jgi:hypothetical protein
MSSPTTTTPTKATLYNHAHSLSPSNPLFKLESLLLNWRTVKLLPSPSKNIQRLLVCTVLWFIAYYIMAFFGGAVAFWRMPRQETTDPEPYTLPDLVFDYVLPHKFCPKLGGPKGQNIQSISLGVYYIYIAYLALFGHPQGVLCVQRFFLVNCLMFLTRTTVVGVTSLPNPNYHPSCMENQVIESNYWESLEGVALSGFPPSACGDLIYSGHTACTFMSMFIFHKMDVFAWHSYPKVVKAMLWLFAVAAIISIFGCRSHYTVDVILGLYFAWFLSTWYFQRSDGLIDDWFSKKIRWLEGQDIVFRRPSFGGGGAEGDEDPDRSVERLNVESLVLSGTNKL